MPGARKTGGNMSARLTSGCDRSMSRLWSDLCHHGSGHAVQGSNRPPVTPPAYDWSGPYLGANFGGSWSNGTANVAGTAWDPGATSFVGGFELGYTWQFDHLLVGVEGTFDAVAFDRPNTPLATPWRHALESQPTSGSITARSAAGGPTTAQRLSSPTERPGPARVLSAAGWLAEESNTHSSPIGRSSLSTTISGSGIGPRPRYPRRVGTAMSR